MEIWKFTVENFEFWWPVLTSTVSGVAVYFTAKWSLEHKIDTETRARVEEQRRLKILELSHEERSEVATRERAAVFAFHGLMEPTVRELSDLKLVSALNGPHVYNAHADRLEKTRKELMISLNGVRTFVVRSPDLVQRARLFVVAWERDYLVMREPLNDLATTDKSLWEKVLREAVAGAEVPSASCVTAHNDFLNAVNDYLQVVYYGRTLPDAAYRELTTETEEAG